MPGVPLKSCRAAGQSPWVAALQFPVMGRAYLQWLCDECDAETAVFLFALTPGAEDTVYAACSRRPTAWSRVRPPAMPAGRSADTSSSTDSSARTHSGASPANRAWRWGGPAASTSPSTARPARSLTSRSAARPSWSVAGHRRQRTARRSAPRARGAAAGDGRSHDGRTSAGRRHGPHPGAFRRSPGRVCAPTFTPAPGRALFGGDYTLSRRGPEVVRRRAGRSVSLRSSVAIAAVPAFPTSSQTTFGGNPSR